MERSFSLFDKDGDGSISAAELKSVLSNLGEDVTDEMVLAMIDLGDTNNCEEVHYDDFLRLMTGQSLPPKSPAPGIAPHADVKELFDKIDADGAPMPLHCAPRMLQIQSQGKSCSQQRC